MTSKHAVLLCFACVLLALVSAGCGGDDKGISNDNPGNNDLNVVVAFGDSITQGSECDCPSYPARLAGLIGKSVVNTGVGGSLAVMNISRTQEAINKYHPAFMLILYGINDVNQSRDMADITSALLQMVQICKANNVTPAIATYPIQILGHSLFAGRTGRLNENIRAIADSEGIHLVDLEYEFNADPMYYMEDGLHPNELGTELIALAFGDLF